MTRVARLVVYVAAGLAVAFGSVLLKRLGAPLGLRIALVAAAGLVAGAVSGRTNPGPR